jgi:uncharacterized membrane protein YgaE (UPF0421/DUF939 family)
MREPRNRLGFDGDTLKASARATVAAVISLLLARTALRLPEFYWAPVSTIVIILSATNPLTLAWQRFVGTALGAILAAAIATFFHGNWIVYGMGIFLCGMFSAGLRLGAAYRFAAIALTIVLLVNHGQPPWIVAVHRFVEVSLGIAVALVVAVVWKIPASTQM